MKQRTTEAAVLLAAADSEFSMRELQLAELAAGEILVRIEASGICHTDLALLDMVERPCVLGHEGTGVVEATGPDVTDVREGDCVVLAYPSCGACGSCRAGSPYLCERNFELSFSGCRACGGTTASLVGQPVLASIFQQSSFATRVIAGARNAVVVPADIPREVRASLTCAVSTGAGLVARHLRLGAGDSLLVFGAGVVGLSAVMASHAVGAAAFIADPLPERRELALSLGAAAAFDPLSGDFTGEVGRHFPAGVAHVVDTSGAQAAWSAAFDLLAMGGTFLFVTVPQPHESASVPAFELMKKGAAASAVIQGSAVASEFIPQLVDWYRDGRFPIDRLITCYPFDAINRAFGDMAGHRVIKPVLLMD
jgi:aryl-alcohol dehydrogenase